MLAALGKHVSAIFNAQYQVAIRIKPWFGAMPTALWACFRHGKRFVSRHSYGMID